MRECCACVRAVRECFACVRGVRECCTCVCELCVSAVSDLRESVRVCVACVGAVRVLYISYHNLNQLKLLFSI